MVLSLKTWKSRSLPVLPRTNIPHHDDRHSEKRPSARAAVLFLELPSKNGKTAARETGSGFLPAAPPTTRRSGGGRLSAFRRTAARPTAPRFSDARRGVLRSPAPAAN